MTEFFDCYKILGIDEAATQEQISSAYRRLILKHHPDRNNHHPDAVETSIRLRHAYETLSKAVTRAQHDDDREKSKPASFVLQNRVVPESTLLDNLELGPGSAQHHSAAGPWIANRQPVFYVVLVLLLITFAAILRLQITRAQDSELMASDRIASEQATIAPTRPVSTEHPDYDELYNLGRSQLESSRIQAAVYTLRQCVSASPGRADAHQLLGTAYIDAGLTVQGIAELKESAWLDPSNADRYTAVAMALIQTSSFGDASVAAKKAVALNPQNVNALLALGESYRRLHNNAAATRAYNKALDVDPACLSASLALQKMKNPDVEPVNSSIGLKSTDNSSNN